MLTKALPFLAICNVLVIITIAMSCQQNSSTSKTSDTDFPGFVSLPSSKTHVVNSNDLPETQETNNFIWDSYYNGGGVAAGDVNNDGLTDLYFTNTMKPNALYINKGNFEFEEVAQKAGVDGGIGVSWGATMADINADGWLDIYVSKSGASQDYESQRNRCYINNKNGTFTDMAKAMGIDNPGHTVQSAFFDYDLDGDLDLFVMNQPSNSRSERAKYTDDNEKEFTNEITSNRMFRNDGNMKFTDVSAEAGVVSFIYGLGLKICDLNGDQWPDVYVASDFNWADQALINNHDGTFTDAIHQYFDHISNFSMGMDIGDINNDALEDIFILDMAGIDHYRSKTNMPSMNPKKFWKVVNSGKHYQYMHNVLQLNQGNGQYSEIAYQAGLSKTDWSWGVLMMDADNDGLQDIYISNGIKRDVRNSDYTAKFMKMIDEHSVPDDLMQLVQMIPSTPMANFMYHNDGHLHFSDKAKAWGLDELSFSSGCAFADLDKDGDLDIVVNNVDKEAFVYENKANKTGRHYIQFAPTSSKTAKPIEGTRITLYSQGKFLQTQYFHPVHGFMSSCEPIVHFGLGEINAIDSAVVVWPNLNVSVISNPKVDSRIVLDMDNINVNRKFSPHNVVGNWATDLSTLIIPGYVHQENEYDDYKDQILLPYRMSTLGPALIVGDVNGDHREDFFIGGAQGQASQMYLQQSDGRFTKSASQPWSKEMKSDVLGSLFFDADGDQDEDLYVATGGSELLAGDPDYADHLYLNDGKGGYSASTNLPSMNSSTKAVAAGDWDKDGDLDLFVGSRNMPRKYPYADKSHFLRNDAGKFTDVTKEVFSGNAQLGMISDAVFADKDKDGDMDLLVCGDWMPISWLMNENGKFVRAKSQVMDSLSGWWNAIELADINKDGILDILAGNAGTNNKFKANKKEPFLVFASDFDMNGTSDIVLATHFDGKEVPVRGRECSSQQLPYIKNEFPTYDGFAKASLQEIIGKERLQGSLQYALTEFKSGIFWGTAEGDYRWEPFPVEAQFSPIVGFAIEDVNGDGVPEVIGAGNLFDTEVETTRYDAGKGVIMSWTQDGWMNHAPTETGFYAGGNIRSLKPIKVGSKNGVLTARDNGKLSLYVFGNSGVQ